MKDIKSPMEHLEVAHSIWRDISTFICHKIYLCITEDHKHTRPSDSTHSINGLTQLFAGLHPLPFTQQPLSLFFFYVLSLGQRRHTQTAAGCQTSPWQSLREGNHDEVGENILRCALASPLKRSALLSHRTGGLVLFNCVSFNRARFWGSLPGRSAHNEVCVRVTRPGGDTVPNFDSHWRTSAHAQHWRRTVGRTTRSLTRCWGSHTHFEGTLRGLRTDFRSQGKL